MPFLSTSSEEVVFPHYKSSGSCCKLTLHFCGGSVNLKVHRNTNNTCCKKYKISFSMCCTSVLYRMNHKKRSGCQRESFEGFSHTQMCCFSSHAPRQGPPLCVWIVDAGRGSGTKRITDQLQLDSR